MGGDIGFLVHDRQRDAGEPLDEGVADSEPDEPGPDDADVVHHLWGRLTQILGSLKPDFSTT